MFAAGACQHDACGMDLQRLLSIRNLLHKGPTDCSFLKRMAQSKTDPFQLTHSSHPGGDNTPQNFHADFEQGIKLSPTRPSWPFSGVHSDKSSYSQVFEKNKLLQNGCSTADCVIASYPIRAKSCLMLENKVDN